MSLSSVLAAMQTINSNVTGVAQAFTRPPQVIDTADIPSLITYWQSSAITNPNYTQREVTHTIMIRLVGEPLGQNIDHAARQERLEPFFERVLDAYDGAVQLGSLSGVHRSEIINAVANWAGEYATIEFTFQITEKYNVTVGL